MEIVLEVCFGVFPPPPPSLASTVSVSELVGTDQRVSSTSLFTSRGDEMEIKFRLN